MLFVIKGENPCIFSSILLAMHICYNLVINRTLYIALDKKAMSKLAF